LRIVVDSSALIAIAENEPERDRFLIIIEAADDAFCSAVTLLETGIVLIRRKVDANAQHATRLAEHLGLEGVPFTHDQMIAAIDGYRRYGKGLGRRPYLNFGDCIAYALAQTMDTPLLFKGDDFAATDVKTCA
jgi:ribonuclease VapC